MIEYTVPGITYPQNFTVSIKIKSGATKYKTHFKHKKIRKNRYEK